ncbi:MAG: sulfatase-like hydrolase/transferase, partial [Planctomycetes bacterium]|nr:sulfatase-like hydrolase/transferase [Planctomycetota bacterium]
MKQPNILIICSDQQHWAMNSVNGHAQVQTPNMQRLADMGCNFRNTYSPSPVCVPARAALFSGLYPHEVG